MLGTRHVLGATVAVDVGGAHARHGAQLAADRLEAVKGAPRYTAIESLFVATEAVVAGNPGYTRQTWVTRIGGLLADTIDYKIVTVQVTNSQLAGNVRKTTVIAPF